MPESSVIASLPAGFVPTRWTLIVAARQEDPGPAMRALAELCQAYWRPLYAYVRRQGCGPEEAEDMTQEFFSRLLEKNYLADVDRAKGKFRSFLLVSLKHFLSKEWERARAQKRGGGRPIIALDSLTAEARARIEPTDNLSPDKAFERQWALTVLDQALARLRAEYTLDGKEALFDVLKIFLTGAGRSSTGGTYAEIGAACGLGEGAAKVVVHRLRRRYRDILREEIAQTVVRRDEIDDEIRSLFAAFD
ncbi:MAG TPA: sigma-70 family RNA polymerase sigma factor [Chthoniobacteraceae bacterium]|nr:sigma-70 family RNA polymerase sigma factor [Chthoniobacteraceae bacterium]